jgi:hypothetical protein
MDQRERAIYTWLVGNDTYFITPTNVISVMQRLRIRTSEKHAKAWLATIDTWGHG